MRGLKELIELMGNTEQHCEHCAFMCSGENPCVLYDAEEYLCQLAVHEDAEEQGRLVLLPCKVGDTVYSYCDTFHKIAPYKIEMIQLYGHDTVNFIAGWNKNGEAMDELDFDADEIGTTVFLTRAEAEAALAAMKGEQP